MTPTNPNYLLPKGEMLKARRMELGLTQDDLAGKAKVSKNTISNYERNVSQATPSSATALAETLEMELMDLFDTPAPTVDEALDAEMVEVVVNANNPPLKITSQADDILKMAAAGLEKDDGSPERVSFAIANISGYLRSSIIHRAPKLKEHTQGLVDTITVALSTAILDPDRTSMEDLWSVMKNGIAELKALDRIPAQAKVEADAAIAALQKSRMDNDDTQRLQAVKAVLYWLHDYWTSICKEQAAYNALSGVCCCLASAPTDYSIRSRLVAHVNTFAAYVDTVLQFFHKHCCQINHK